MKRKFFLILSVVLFLGSGIVLYIWKAENRPQILEIYVFNLKSGRSMFIRSPEDIRILVDGGGNSSVIREITRILPFYSKRIDYMVSTGFEGKNVSGLIDVLGRYKVGQVILPKHDLISLGIATSNDSVYEAFEAEIQKSSPDQSIKVEIGDEVILDSGIKFCFLFPTDGLDFQYSKTSAPELLFSVEFSGVSAFFLGNATKKVQDYIASSIATTSNESVLIVSHSASPDSISAVLMRKINPKYLVFSKVIQKSSRKKSVSKSVSTNKIKSDPLAGILEDKRFNIKQNRVVKIVSDGESLKIDYVK